MLELREQDVIVFEGDSLTSRRRGPNADDWAYLRMLNWHRTYPQLVEEWLFANLPELRLKVRCAAAGGSSILEMHRRYDAQVKAHNPTVMVFTIGNNDPNRMELSAFVDELGAYLEQLRQDGQPRLLYVGDFLPCPNADDSVAPRCEKAAPFNAAAGKLVTEYGGACLRVGAILKRKAEMLYEQSTCHTVYAEGRHLNLLGAHIVAAQVLQALGAYAHLSRAS